MQFYQSEFFELFEIVCYNVYSITTIINEKKWWYLLLEQRQSIFSSYVARSNKSEVGGNPPIFHNKNEDIILKYTIYTQMNVHSKFSVSRYCHWCSATYSTYFPANLLCKCEYSLDNQLCSNFYYRQHLLVLSQPRLSSSERN